MSFILQQCPPTMKTLSELVAHVIPKSEMISEQKQALIKAFNQHLYTGEEGQSVSIIRHYFPIAFVTSDLISVNRKQRISAFIYCHYEGSPTFFFYHIPSLFPSLSSPLAPVSTQTDWEPKLIVMLQTAALEQNSVSPDWTVTMTSTWVWAICGLHLLLLTSTFGPRNTNNIAALWFVVEE